MPIAEIITIGTELLLGETVDTNTRYIARVLRDNGVDLYRTSTIGDNPDRISQIIREGMNRAEIIITTGGLGPTVDDPTREAVAKAMGVETEFRESLWEQIQERFNRYGRQPTENNKRQAYVPGGALAVENPVGTAPAFIVETDRHAIIALPGVPREMEFLMQNDVMPYLQRRFKLSGVIKARVLHTSGVGESQIDDRIGDLERLSNPTVGLAAHAGQVDVRITVKADTEVEADEEIRKMEQTLRQRLGSWIYGADEDTLEQVALDTISELGWSLCVVESGLNGMLTQSLARAKGPFLGSEVLTKTPDLPKLIQTALEFRDSQDAHVSLGVALQPGETKQTLNLILITPEEERQITHTFGGPPQLASLWSRNLCLDLLRRL
jgi:competence/damage-inducible protein CinA-like protein